VCACVCARACVLLCVCSHFVHTLFTLTCATTAAIAPALSMRSALHSTLMPPPPPSPPPSAPPPMMVWCHVPIVASLPGGASGVELAVWGQGLELWAYAQTTRTQVSARQRSSKRTNAPQPFPNCPPPRTPPHPPTHTRRPDRAHSPGPPWPPRAWAALAACSCSMKGAGMEMPVVATE
jgi:hypothetical protein